MKKLLSIKGKSDRFEWWTVSLISDVLMQLSGLIGFWMMFVKEGLPNQIGGFLLVLLAASFLWISLAVTFRRLRDRGRPMWFILFTLLPFVGWIWLIIECGFLPSSYTGPKRTLVRKKVTANQSHNTPSLTLHSSTDH